MKPLRRIDRGFTLLEVVIALAIAVLGIAAVAKATGGAATVAAETKERILAVWLAGNRLAELRITRSWPAADSYQAERTMGGRKWFLVQTVDTTDNPGIRRVEIEVYTDPQRTQREYRMYGYIARYAPPREGAEGSDDDQGREAGEDNSQSSANGIDPGGGQ